MRDTMPHMQQVSSMRTKRNEEIDTRSWQTLGAQDFSGSIFKLNGAWRFPVVSAHGDHRRSAPVNSWNSGRKNAGENAGMPRAANTTGAGGARRGNWRIFEQNQAYLMGLKGLPVRPRVLL
jgi:hypothetical protein